MREALNRAGQLVDADAATSGWRLYACPECRAPVTLRAGGSKRAYFAHMPGRSGKDCILYVEGGAYGPGLTGLNDDVGDGAGAMCLGLRLSESRTPRGWGLELIVPTGGHIGLELTVDVGGRTEFVRCTSGTEKQKNIVVDPVARDYEILSVSSTASSYAANLQRTCEGLESRYATVFGEIRRPGKEVAKRVWEVSVGRTYALVWPANLAPVFPPYLDYEPLQSRPGWGGALVTFSYPVDKSVQEWLLGVTGLNIATTLPEIVPVWPPLVRRVTGGVVEAPAKSALIVSAGRLTSHGIIGVSALFALSVTEEIGQNSKSVSEPFFQLVPALDNTVELTCLDPARASLNIDIVASTKYPVQSGVELAGVERSGAIQTVGLHESAATPLLEAIRGGEISFNYLSIPKHVVGYASIGRGGLWEELLTLNGSDAPAPHDTEARLLSPVDVTALVEVLARRNDDVLLDFGAFGRVIAIGSSAPAYAPSLSKGLRERLLAYLFQTHGRIAPGLNARNAEDTEIISEFLKEPPDATGATWRSLKAVLELEVRVRKVNARTGI